MKRSIRYIIFILVLSMTPTKYCNAQDGVEPNPVLAGTIVLYKTKQEKALRAQKLAQELVAEGHVFVGREVQATNEYLREFNNYLDHFHDVVSLAAEVFGTYYEIKRTAKLVSQISSVVSSAPSNTIAVLLKPNSSGLYTSIIQTSLGAAQDLYNACLSKQKRTEQDRNKILDSARLKIKEANKQLAQLLVVLKYTTFEDIWFSVRERAKFMDRDHKRDIIERCYDNWKHNIR